MLKASLFSSQIHKGPLRHGAKVLFFVLCIGSWAMGQVEVKPYLSSQYHLLKLSDHSLAQQDLLLPFFNQLRALENDSLQQVNIVHIGDSHLQGPYLPQYIRTSLQSRFGNAGRGFVFPYRVAGTNGGIDVKFKGNGDWVGVRNVKSDGTDDVGVSGFYFAAKANDQILQVDLNVQSDQAIQVEVLGPNPQNWELLLSDQKNLIKTAQIKKRYTVKSGDFLGKIARRFNTSVKAIKKANKLRSDRINIGQKLQIPTGQKKTSVTASQSFTRLGSGASSIDLPLSKDQFFLKNKMAEDQLDGLVLKQEAPGVLYHGIGVNGAKYEDYNRFPRFFAQVNELQPDLVIVSLGTNESFFSPYSKAQLKEQMSVFIAQLREKGVLAPILLTSPPPSMKKRRHINHEATTYSHTIRAFATQNQLAFYDWHEVLQTSTAAPALREAGHLSKDRIHYTEQGYKLQAYLLVDALLNTYDQTSVR